MFLVFGYFAEDEEHADALGQMLSVARAGGWFVIDFLNAEQVRSALVPEEVQRFGKLEVRIERRVTPDDRFVREDDAPARWPTIRGASPPAGTERRWRG